MKTKLTTDEKEKAIRGITYHLIRGDHGQNLWELIRYKVELLIQQRNKANPQIPLQRDGKFYQVNFSFYLEGKTGRNNRRTLTLVNLGSRGLRPSSYTIEKNIVRQADEWYRTMARRHRLLVKVHLTETDGEPHSPSEHLLTMVFRTKRSVIESWALSPEKVGAFINRNQVCFDLVDHYENEIGPDV